MKKMVLRLMTYCKGTVKKILAYGNYSASFRPVKKDGKWMRKPCHEELLYDAMTFDINNTCNLRCRFCFNDFEKKACYMTEEVYRRILGLFPLIRPVKKQGAGILFSCLYEPSIAPNFLEFLKMLPPTGRKNVFFTSNFCRAMTEEEIRTIFSANIRHVNLSVETLRAQRYREICASVQFDSFYRNLERIAAVNARRPLGKHRAKLYCITMVLKENRDELSAIGRFCADKLRAARHEFRTPYISATANHGDWNMGQLMDEEECSQVRRELTRLRLPLMLDIHSKDELSAGMEADAGRTGQSGPAADRTQQERAIEQKLDEMRLCMSKDFLFLRFHPSGLCTSTTEERFSIADVEDSYDFFRERLKGLYRRRAEAFLAQDLFDAGAVREIFDTGAVKESPMHIVLYGMRENPVYLLLEGWIKGPEASEELLLLAAAKGKTGEKQMFLTLKQPCPPWVHNQKEGLYGFALCLDWNKVARPLTDLEFLMVDKGSLAPICRCRYPYGIL